MARQRVESGIAEDLSPAPAHLPALSPRRWPVFASLGHRNYLLLWIGSLFSNTGDWMDQVALNWRSGA